jgi:hypothetical protein
MVLDKLENHENCVYQIDGDTWKVWYPLDAYLEDIDAANEALGEHEFELTDIVIKANN